MKRVLLLLGLMCLVTYSRAQSLDEVDKQITGHLSKIMWLGADTAKNAAALIDENTQLIEYLVKTTGIPDIMTAPLQRAIRRGVGTYDFQIVNSPDNKLRIFSWNSYTVNNYFNGRRQCYHAVMLYKDADNVTRALVAHEDPPGQPGINYPIGLCEGIYELYTKNHKALYLISEVSWPYPRIKCENITGYTVNGNTLEKYALFANGSFNTYIEWNVDSWRKRYRGPDLHFDEVQKKLFIPKTIHRTLLESYDVCTFDGNIFVP